MSSIPTQPEEPVTLSDRPYVHATRVRYVGTRAAQQLATPDDAAALDLAVCEDVGAGFVAGDYALFVEGSWRRAELTDDDRVFFDARPNVDWTEMKSLHRAMVMAHATGEAIPDDAVFLVCEPGTMPKWRAISDACEREWTPATGRQSRKVRTIVAQPRDHAELVREALACIRYVGVASGESSGLVDGVPVRFTDPHRPRLLVSYGEVAVIPRDFMRGPT